MTASTLNAALGFSVSLWRQIDVLKGLGCLPLYTHQTEPPFEINQNGILKNGFKRKRKGLKSASMGFYIIKAAPSRECWQLPTTQKCCQQPPFCLVCRMILPQVHLR